jgi:hypothetical protein
LFGEEGIITYWTLKGWLKATKTGVDRFVHKGLHRGGRACHISSSVRSGIVRLLFLLALRRESRIYQVCQLDSLGSPQDAVLQYLHVLVV